VLPSNFSSVSAATHIGHLCARAWPVFLSWNSATTFSIIRDFLLALVVFALAARFTLGKGWWRWKVLTSAGGKTLTQTLGATLFGLAVLLILVFAAAIPAVISRDHEDLVRDRNRLRANVNDLQKQLSEANNKPIPTIPKTQKPTTSAYIQADVTGYYPGDPFPVGVPMTLNINWVNRGTDLACNPQPFGKMLLISSESEISEGAAISDWKAEYAKIISGVPKRPEKNCVVPNAPPFLNVANEPSGQKATPEIKQALADRKQFVMVIGACRFLDSVGKHEAHFCATFMGWRAIKKDGMIEHYVNSWNSCPGYNGQIDVQ
jgi:hypothetical protein